MKSKETYKFIFTIMLSLAFIIAGYNLFFSDYTMIKRITILVTLLLIGIQLLINWSDLYNKYKNKWLHFCKSTLGVVILCLGGGTYLIQINHGAKRSFFLDMEKHNGI